MEDTFPTDQGAAGVGRRFQDGSSTFHLLRTSFPISCHCDLTGGTCPRPGGWGPLLYLDYFWYSGWLAWVSGNESAPGMSILLALEQRTRPMALVLRME